MEGQREDIGRKGTGYKGWRDGKGKGKRQHLNNINPFLQIVLGVGFGDHDARRAAGLEDDGAGVGLGGGGEGADFAAGGHVVGFDEGAVGHFVGGLGRGEGRVGWLVWTTL